MRINLADNFPNFKGPLRSADLNDAFQELASYLGVAVELVQKLHKKSRISNLAIAYDSEAISQLATDLQNQQNTLNTSAKVLYRSFSVAGGISSNGVDPIPTTDTEFGMLQLPEVSRRSFIEMVEDGLGELIPDPTVAVYVNGIPQASTASSRYLLSKNKNDVWVEESTTSGDRVIKIVFPRPPQIAPNYMILSPLPTYKETIHSVVFRDFNDVYNTPFTGFPSSITTKRKFIFSGSAFKSELMFSITPWFVGGKYVYGARSVDLGYIDFSSKAVARFSVSNSDTINNVIGISHLPINGQFLTPGPIGFGYVNANPLIIRVFTNSGYSNKIWDNAYSSYPSSASPISAGGVSTLYIEVELNKVSDASPYLQNIAIAYN